MPLDLVLTGGLYGAFGDVNLFRVPVASRLVTVSRSKERWRSRVCAPPCIVDFCSDAAATTTTNLDQFDLGADLELSRQLRCGSPRSSRGDLFGEDDGFGISIAWRPAALSPR